MNNKEKETVKVLNEIADILLLIGEHLGTLTNTMNSILEHVEENTPKVITELSDIAENTSHIL